MEKIHAEIESAIPLRSAPIASASKKEEVLAYDSLAPTTALADALCLAISFSLAPAR